MLLMQRANEITHLRTQHALHRPLLEADDMHLDIPRAQRRCHFEPDEARADHHRTARILRGSNDGAAVVQRAQQMDMGLVRAPGREKKPALAPRPPKTRTTGGMSAR